MGFTLEAMRFPIEALGYQVIGELPIFRVFNKGKVKEDKESMDRAFKLGRKLARALMEKTIPLNTNC